MMVIEMLVPSYIGEFIKIIMIVIFSNFVYLKISMHERIKLNTNILLVFSGVISSILYVICIKAGLIFIPFLVASLFNGVILFALNNKQEISFIFTYMLSLIISYVIYGISIILSSFIIGVIGTDIDAANVWCFAIIVILNILLNIAFGRIKRIKKGFNFLKKIDVNITVIVLLFSGVVIILFAILPKNIAYESQELRFIGSIFIGTSLFIVINKLITKHYKRNMRDRTIAIQKEEIDTNVKVIEELKEQNLKLSTTIHKYNHRLSALESSIRKVMDKSNTEFASELSIVLEQTKNVASQFADETKVKTELPSTNLIAIDNMLEYMRNEAVKHDIDFTLKLSDSIKPLLEKYISEDKFETLLADHVKDAIIAINAKNDGYKSIMVLIGAVQGAYELSIYDTGIEFDIPTLLKLGTEPVTTHKDNGGSGLGFMTTFETLKSSKASLVIEEYDTSVTNYTKSVTIRFDGKYEYRIYSYRAEQIKNACGGRKMVIKKI